MKIENIVQGPLHPMFALVLWIAEAVNKQAKATSAWHIPELNDWWTNTTLTINCWSNLVQWHCLIMISHQRYQLEPLDVIARELDVITH